MKIIEHLFDFIQKILFLISFKQLEGVKMSVIKDSFVPISSFDVKKMRYFTEEDVENLYYYEDADTQTIIKLITK
jgi:hypothetical protein